MKKYIYSAIFLATAFILKSQAPAFQWADKMGGNTYDSGGDLAVDASGNVYTTGYFSGVSDFDPGPGTATLSSAGSYSSYLTKFDAAGNFVWVKNIVDGNSTAYGQGIDIDASGNIYIVGVFDGTADFDPTAAANTVITNGNSDMFILKYDASGSVIWAKTIGGTGPDALNAVSVDASSNVYLTGSFGSTVDFDPGAATYTVASAGSSDIFALKLTSGGNFTWVKTMPGTGFNNGSFITAHNAGNVFITGNFASTADFDPSAATYTLTATGNYDAFIVKLDASGNFGWAKQIGAGPGEYAYGYNLATNAAGDVYNIGSFTGTADLDPGPGTLTVTSAGSDDMYINKLNSAGTFQWAKKIGGTGDDIPYGLALDTAGHIYITGSFESVVDFDPSVGTYTIAAAGNDDVFITKLDANSNLIWSISAGGASSQVYGYAIDVDASSNIYVTGNFNLVEDFNPSTLTYTLSSAGYTDAFVLKLGQCSAPAAPVNTTALSALTICSGNTTSLTAAGTGTVSWYAAATSTTALATGSLYVTPVLAAGTYTYYAGVTACTSSITRAAITVTVNTCAGIQSFNPPARGLSIYPNPTSGLITLKIDNYTPGLTLEVYNTLGEWMLLQKPGADITTINLGNSAAGIYVVKLVEDGKLLDIKKVIKE